MIGETLQSRYRLDSELGRGGMGVVYRAHDTLLDRAVAVKVLNDAGLGSEGRARLLREAQSAARLSHPNIISVYDAGEANLATALGAGGVPFIVMELVKGESLHSRWPTALAEILSIARQVCAALDHAHAHGIIHRDLKPENVLVTSDGSAKLMDFGMAHSVTSRPTGEGAIVGTLFYLAPELALGQPFDGRADLYALGAMLYELTTSRLPFTGDDPLAIISQHLHAPVVPPRTHRADLPLALEAIILKLLAKNPADRFASARDVARVLNEVAPVKALPKFVDVSRHNLPLRLSSFVGREQEIGWVKQLVSESRLVTLTGSGGCGKTRLALQVGSDLAGASAFEQGVWWVELAALSEPALVPQTVAKALGVSETPNQPLTESLAHHLLSQHLLLVVDNCEHLLTACAQLAETLMLAAPGLRILATSREPLAVAGEQAWLVPSLALPPLQPPAQSASRPSSGVQIATSSLQPPISDLQPSDAVQLFVERAASALPAFGLTPRNAAAVAQVCRRLDGIPLAIELAAARVRVLAVEQIAARLDDCFALLTSGNRTALIPRHQTLRATMDWSHDLLAEPEQVLFRRLAVFAGGFTLEAAEAVCAEEDERRTTASRDEGDLRPHDVLDLLTQLVNKSLVVAETQMRREARYHLLETIRQYGSGKLYESGEEMLLRRRHRDWFLALAEQADAEWYGPTQAAWSDRLETEHDNLRAALEWCRTEPEGVEAGLRLGAALRLFWDMRGYLREGRERLMELLALPGAAGSGAAAARARALAATGYLAFQQGDHSTAVSFLEEGVSLGRDIGDKRVLALALDKLGLVAVRTRPDDERTHALLEESLALGRELGDQKIIYSALFYLADLAQARGQYQRARQLHEESLVLMREQGDEWHVGLSLFSLGHLAWMEQDYERAAVAFQESLAVRWQLKDWRGIAFCLEGSAWVAAMRGQAGQAAQRFGAAEALLEAIGAALHPVRHAAHDQSAAAARAMLGEAAFALAWAEGRTLTIERAVQEALRAESADRTPASVSGPLPPAPGHPLLLEPLNEREREVLRLIEDGLSNREIAENLVVAVSTVKWHINNLYGKLGARSRTQALARAKELGLL